MTGQPLVPNSDGPILLLLDVSSRCGGTLSLKMPRSAGVAASRALLLCRRIIDPPASRQVPRRGHSGAIFCLLCHMWRGFRARARPALVARLLH